MKKSSPERVYSIEEAIKVLTDVDVDFMNFHFIDISYQREEKLSLFRYFLSVSAQWNICYQRFLYRF